MFAKRKTLVLLGAALAVLLIAGGVFAYLRRHHPSQTNNANTTINYGPATDQEKQETEAHKQELNDQAQKDGTPPPPPADNSGKRSVTPIIVSAAQYDNTVEVTSYVSGIIEDGGTCTITLAKGQTKVVKTVTGVRDAKVTRCPIVAVPTSELSAGSWVATVTYSSNAAAGASQPSQSFEVK